MPIYCYKLPSGEIVERTFPIGRQPETIQVNGSTARRDFKAEHPGAGHRPSCWPMESDAAGVHPSQVKEAAAHARAMGVPTEFNTETGNPIFTSQKHRRDFCRAHGLYDRNAGYGDPAPVNR